MADRGVTRRGGALPWTLFAAATLSALALGWRAYGPARHGDALATSLLAFARADRLQVFSAELAPVVASDDTRMLGVLHSKQIAVIPARVDYGVNLAAVGRGRMGWDAAAHRLSVRLPALDIGRPNLDEARAQYLREGVWITRAAQETLTRENTLAAEEQAARSAQNPALLALARAAAKDAVRANLAAALAAAGYADASVDVHIDGEPPPG